MRAAHSHNRGSEERFYIGTDRGTLFECREEPNRELWRNPKAISVPHVSFTARPYTLNCREERTPGQIWGHGKGVIDASSIENCGFVSGIDSAP